MLSIRARSGHNWRYYLATKAEAYYLDDSLASCWLGRCASKLGLSGPVKNADFVNLFEGCGPHGEKLVQNAKKEKRQAAWDLTFSLPKSAGVVWAVADAERQATILRAHVALLNPFGGS